MNTSSFSPTEAIGFGWNTVMKNKKFWIILAFMMLIIGNANGGTNFFNSFSKLSEVENTKKSDEYIPNAYYNNGNQNMYENMMNDSMMMEETDVSVPFVPEKVDEVLGISDQRDNGNVVTFVVLLVIVLLLFTIPIIIMSIFISIAVQMGFLKLFIAAARGNEVKYELILSEVKGSKAVQYLLANFLFGLLVVVGFIFFIIPGIYFALKYMFVPYAVVDKNATIGDAFGMSSRATKGNKLNLFALGILVLLINMLGVFALFYGLLITIPVTSLAYAYAYHKLAGGSSSEISSSK